MARSPRSPFMVTVPLREPVREIEPAEVAYPTDLCAYNDWMETHEQDRRDAEHPPSAAE
jgi:hypothetical protein